MTTTFNGKIVVTQNLFLKLADQNFLEFTGMDMYSSVAEVFSEESAEVIRSAPERLKKGEFTAILSLRRSDGVYCDVVANITSVREEGTIYTGLEINELSGLLAKKSVMDTYERITETFFELLGSIMLWYECATEQLEIFYVSDSKRHYIFKGLLNEWRDMVFKDRLDPEYTEQFTLLCRDMATARKRFAHTVRIKSFIGGIDNDVCSFNCRSLYGGDGNNVVLGCIDIGDPEKMKNVIIDPVNDKDSFLDMLNKRAIIEQAKRILSMGSMRKSFFIILDLDNFKTVNDTYGHIVGDEVLVRVTKIINENIGRRGFVGRVGGDEIFIVTESIEEQTELRNMLRSIRTAVEWTFKDDPRDINVTCSIGACAYPENGKDFNSLFELADKMLYIAKQKGKNRYIIYTPELHDHLLNQNSSEVIVTETPTGDLVNDKVGIMHRLVDNYLIRHSYNNEKIFSEVGVGFGLSEILMVYEDFTNLFQWTPEGGVDTDISIVPYFKPDAAFGELFNKNKLLVLDGLYKLDGKCPDIEKCLASKGIKSALIYRIDKMGRFSGYVVFARAKQRQMWSEYEIMALSTVAKVFEVSMRE